MKKIQITFLVLIAVLIILPTVFFNHDKNQYSYIDNRVLKEMNDISTGSIEDYINDRIGFRKEIIFSFNKLNKVLFNYSSNPKYIYSDDGIEVYNKVELEGTEKNYYDSFAKAISEIDDYLDSKNIPFYYVITPSKASIYKGSLPGCFNYSDENIIYFQNIIKNNDINYINLFDILKVESKNKRVFNKEYDVFHWNDYGLFIGSNAILKEINKTFPSVQENKIEDFDVTHTEGKDLIKKEYVIDEEVDLYDLKAEYSDLSDQYRDKLDLYEDFQEFYYLKTQNTDKPKILMFGGSYFINENRYEHLCNQSSEFIIIHNYNNIFNIKKYVEMFNPDLVIFDTCEYTFQEYYFSEYYMRVMDLN